MSEGGRPSTYTQELGNLICAEMAAGKSLREICKRDDMPARSTVHLWVIKDLEGFSDRYATAQSLRFAEMADEMFEIADDGRNDWIERQKDDGSTYEVANTEHINRSRLRVDTRKWVLSKLVPEYNEKHVLVGDKDRPVQSENKLTIEFVAPKA